MLSSLFWKCEEEHTDQSALIFLEYLWKETAHKPSTVAAATNPLSSVYVIGTAYFDECFLFYVITRRHYF